MGAAEGGRIVVTGASSGIGRACALRLAQRGCTVWAGVRSSADAEALRAVSPATLHPILLDVTRADSVASAVEAVGDLPLTGLVNNAGVAMTGPLELLPIESWRRQFEVNVLGLVAVTQAFLPKLRGGPGRIVNIGSIAGRSALPGTGAYDSSKFAVAGITDSLRMELRPFGIRVCLIEPGAVATGVWEKTLNELDGLSRNAPSGRLALYAGLMATIRRETQGTARRAIASDAVAKAVEHALFARRPKTRYIVGVDAWLWRALNLLPDRWRDWVILRGIDPTPAAR